MPYDVKIKGRKDAIRVEDFSKGIGIKNAWDKFTDTGIDTKVDVGMWTGFVSSISDMFRVEEAKADKVNTVNEDYEKERKEILKLSPEERAKKMGFFRLVYLGFTDNDSKEVKTLSGKPIEDLAYDIQLKFFKENPYRIFCEPICYRQIIKAEKCDSIIMRVIEQQIREDKYHAVRGY